MQTSSHVADFKDKLEAETDFYIVYKNGKQDKTRLLIRHKNSVDYGAIDRQLRFMGVQSEFSSQLGLLMMPSIMTIQEDFDRLLDALKRVVIQEIEPVYYKIFRPEQAADPGGFLAARLSAELSGCGRPCRDGVYHSLSAGLARHRAGEIMSRELADYLDTFEGNIVGLEHEGYVNVIDEDKVELAEII